MWLQLPQQFLTREDLRVRQSCQSHRRSQIIYRWLSYHSERASKKKVLKRTISTKDPISLEARTNTTQPKWGCRLAPQADRMTRRCCTRWRLLTSQDIARTVTKGRSRWRVIWPYSAQKTRKWTRSNASKLNRLCAGTSRWMKMTIGRT